MTPAPLLLHQPAAGTRRRGRPQMMSGSAGQTCPKAHQAVANSTSSSPSTHQPRARQACLCTFLQRREDWAFNLVGRTPRAQDGERSESPLVERRVSTGEAAPPRWAPVPVVAPRIIPCRVLMKSQRTKLHLQSNASPRMSRADASGGRASACLRKVGKIGRTQTIRHEASDMVSMRLLPERVIITTARVNVVMNKSSVVRVHKVGWD